MSPRVMETEWRLLRWIVAVYLLCLGLTLTFVIGISLWGVLHDVNQVRETFTRSEMERLRSHALRTMGIVQARLASDKEGGLEQLRDNTGLRRHWQRAVLEDESWRYAAVGGATGT